MSDIDRAVGSNIAQQLQKGFDAVDHGLLEVAAQARKVALVREPG